LLVHLRLRQWTIVVSRVNKKEEREGCDYVSVHYNVHILERIIFKIAVLMFEHLTDPPLFTPVGI